LEGVKKHDDGLKIFERHGIRSYSQALALQGYKVKWSGWIQITPKFQRSENAALMSASCLLQTPS
jgi:hypothetical protein